MKKLKVSYTLTYKITDYELFEELDSNESSWVEFLTYVLDSVRFSEDFTKRWVSTEGDELYWDDEEDHGIAEVLVTIEDNFDGNLEWWNELLPTLKETWDIPIKDNADEFDVDDFATTIAEGGAFWNIVKWGTTIKIDDDSDGCLFEYDDDAREMYIGKVHNVDGSLEIINAEFTNSKGEEYELLDWVKTKYEVLSYIEKLN
jgi:hypothetical protein